MDMHVFVLCLPIAPLILKCSRHSPGYPAGEMENNGSRASHHPFEPFQPSKTLYPTPCPGSTDLRLVRPSEILALGTDAGHICLFCLAGAVVASLIVGRKPGSCVCVGCGCIMCVILRCVLQILLNYNTTIPHTSLYGQRLKHRSGMKASGCSIY